MASIAHTDSPSDPTAVRATSLGSVVLVRFTIRPDRRDDLVESMAAGAGRPAPTVPDATFLVELDDGDWLAISFSHDGADATDAAYVDLADGILGDESGVIVASSRHRADPGNFDHHVTDDHKEQR